MSTFYDACAQVEIDEYRNYEKALGALKEAGKYMAKSKQPLKESKILQIKKKISIVEQYLSAKKLLPSNTDEALAICKDLLDRNDIEDAIRAGDVFATLVEFFYEQRRAQNAFELIEKMRQRRIPLFYFLDKKVVLAIYKAVGVTAEFDNEEEPEEGVREEN